MVFSKNTNLKYDFLQKSSVESENLTYKRFNGAKNYNKTKDKFNCIGYLEFNNKKKLETPIIWYGLSVIESVDFQLNVFKKSGVKAFLSNAFDLKHQDKQNKRKKLIKELKARNLFHKMDSGGFQLMKSKMKKSKNKIKLDPETVLYIQKEFGCDIAVQLDIPLPPMIESNEEKKLIDLTISNFIKAKELNEKMGNPLNIMPVIHGRNIKSIDYCIEKLKEQLNSIPIVGIGSLVPMIKSMKGSGKTGGKWRFIELLTYLRKKLPNSMIHAFGVGGTMSYLAFYCGIDSLDSNGWIQKSAYGVIQLPGIPDRFLTKKSHNRPYLIENRKYKKYGKIKTLNEIKTFMNCKCPICSNYSSTKYKDQKLAFKEKVKLFEQEGQIGRLTRSIHNVYTFNSELEKIKINIKNNTLDNFIEDRLFTSNYYNLFLYAKFLKKGDLKSANKVKNKKNKKINNTLLPYIK
ncbi:MAG: tRNA-guanine transglycosylase [Promethearchaeota archaeon]